MSAPKPGSPDVDVRLVKQARDLAKALKADAKNLDHKSLHDVAAAIYSSLAVVETYKGVRTRQPTNRPGGRRAKRK